MSNQYEPWVSEGISECEYFKKRFLEERQHIAKLEKHIIGLKGNLGHPVPAGMFFDPEPEDGQNVLARFIAKERDEARAELAKKEQALQLALSDASIKHKYRADVLERQLSEKSSECERLKQRCEWQSSVIETQTQSIGTLTEALAHDIPSAVAKRVEAAEKLAEAVKIIAKSASDPDCYHSDEACSCDAWYASRICGWAIEEWERAQAYEAVGE